jgi:hypothetical protein
MRGKPVILKEFNRPFLKYPYLQPVFLRRFKNIGPSLIVQGLDFTEEFEKKIVIFFGGRL